MNNELNGSLFDSLNEEEREMLLKSYDESFDESNLLSHEQVKLEHEKWLKSKF